MLLERTKANSSITQNIKGLAAPLRYRFAAIWRTKTGSARVAASGTLAAVRKVL